MSDAAKHDDMVIVSSGAGSLPKKRFVARHRRLILIIVAAVVLLAGLTTWYVLSNLGGGDKPIKTDTSQLSDDYTQLTPDQIRSKLYNDTGIDINKLTDKKLSARTFKNFNAAYETAQAFNGLKNYKQSQAAYAAAAEKADDTTDYHFYIAYNAIADNNGDKLLSKELSTKTIDSIKADSKLSESQKQELIDSVNQKQKLKDLLN